MMETIKHVLETALNNISEITSETALQDMLHAMLRNQGVHALKRKKFRSSQYPEAEVDIFIPTDDLALEIKLNAKYHAGIGQAMVLKHLFKKSVVIIHVRKHVDDKIRQALAVLSMKAEVPFFLVDSNKKQIEVFP